MRAPYSAKADLPQPNMRLYVLYSIVAAVMALFVARLWQMQVTEGSYYTTLAESNRLRVEAVDAPRGIIYDRNGVLMAQNAPAYDVQIVPAYLPDDEAQVTQVYQRLSKLLDMPVSSDTASLAGASGSGIRDIVEAALGIAPYRAVTIRSDVPRDMALLVREESPHLPGVAVSILSTREYPLGRLTSHVVGYTGRITSVDAERVLSTFVDVVGNLNHTTLGAFADAALAARNYNPDTDRIGLTGIEGEYDLLLRGQKGERYVEEDVAGRQVRVVGTPLDPLPGHNIYLTIDQDLQRVAYEALQEQIDKVNASAGRMRTRLGAVIAIDPRNGQVLALVSVPTYDNNLFSHGISLTEYNALLNDPFFPLVNHAISDQVQPGSIFKIIPAAAVLQEAVVTPRWSFFDTGSITVPNRYFPNDPRQAQIFYSWLRSGHGETNVIKALSDSVNTFFYITVGGLDVPDRQKFDGLGLEKLTEYEKAFGLGSLTGIDLPGEAPAHVATASWKRQNYGESWSTGDTYNLSIGEGFALATPIQMLNATVAVANGGTLYRPQTMLRVVDEQGNAVREFTPDAIGTLPVSAENLAIVRSGMERAVTQGTSTAVQVEGLSIAGKTGTAEFCDGLAVDLGFCANGLVKPTHGWFTAYAPAEQPEIALLVYLYNGGEGSQVALPVAQKILQYWQERRQATAAQ